MLQLQERVIWFLEYEAIVVHIEKYGVILRASEYILTLFITPSPQLVLT